MTPYQSEELENIRRAAKRGKRSVEDWLHTGDKFRPYPWLDCFIHILDTVERIKQSEVKTGIHHPDCQVYAYRELNRDCNCDENYNDNKAQDSIAGH